MNEKKLDQILQQALTPEVNDNEIKVRFEKILIIFALYILHMICDKAV